MTEFNSKLITFFGSLLMMIGTLWLSSAFVSTAGSQQPSVPAVPAEGPSSLPALVPPPPPVPSNDSAQSSSEAPEIEEELSAEPGLDQAQVEEASKDPRDPFRPFNKPIQKEAPPGMPARIGGAPVSTVDPLLGSDVESFQVLAIVWNTEKPRALVQNANKVISKIERLTKIGRNNGFVAEIREGEIVIVEPVVQGSEIGAVTKILTMGVSK